MRILLGSDDIQAGLVRNAGKNACPRIVGRRLGKTGEDPKDIDGVPGYVERRVSHRNA